MIELVKKELVHVSHKICKKGYTQATGGQVSCRIAGEENRFAIKRTAISMGEMTTGDVIIVDRDGNVIEGAGQPSKEVNFHLGIMKARPDINAVVHCHPNYSVSFANNHLPLPITTVTARKVLNNNVPCISIGLAGSKELAELVIEAFKENDINSILMANHGICATGASLEQAYNIADLVEATAKQAYLTINIAENKSLYENMEPIL